MKFFIMSGVRLDYKEIKLYRTKLVCAFVLFGLILVGGMFLGNRLIGDPLGFGSDQVATLAAENRILKEQLRTISRRMEETQESLQSIADRGNELRLMVDLSQIDNDTRKASVGGRLPVSDFSFLNGDASSLLSETNALIDQLSREVHLQRASYEDIYKRYEFNRAKFAHIPAIKPMQGYYSVNGFGMRVHPVLRVYRMHEGVDIINDVGTNIYATGDGVIRYAGRTQGGYGTVVDITHGYGYSSLYAHLSKVMVRPGQRVRRGELIGKSGRSGLVSGPHLHYEVRLNGRKQNPVDHFFDDIDAARYRTLLASATQ
ncbi:MAG: M23 family metallopeptidase [Bacteroidota bacterium]